MCNVRETIGKLLYNGLLYFSVHSHFAALQFCVVSTPPLKIISSAPPFLTLFVSSAHTDHLNGQTYRNLRLVNFLCVYKAYTRMMYMVRPLAE